MNYCICNILVHLYCHNRDGAATYGSYTFLYTQMFIHNSDGMFLIEVDRLLKPGGYFVLTSPTSRPHGSSQSTKKGSMFTQIEEIAQKICWSLLAQQEETIIWQKTMDVQCYTSR